MSDNFVRLSVHGLVDFLLRKGDIDNRIYNQETMQAGTKIHSVYQKSQNESYISEHYMVETFKRPLGTIILDGRADGIIVGGKHPIIDEIKSTVDDLESFYESQKEWHLGQAKCYALLYCHETKREKIGIRLTYISQIDESIMTKSFTFSVKELEKDVEKLMDEYLKFVDKEKTWKQKRNDSLENLKFPYGDFRPGQKKMSRLVYQTATKGGTVFCEAPTGIGKTMSTLYPSVLSFATGNVDKIFYLTAKTTGRESAFKALGDLYESGLVARDSLLTAKDKICFKPGAACNPDECPFAKSYYDNLSKAIADAMESGERFSYEYVTKLAKHYAMCPFELQLDLSLYSDVIICDYNYLFDPMVHLERYFDEPSDPSKYFALIDEAHNLIDRGRDMYSSHISKDELFKAKSSLTDPACKSIKRALTKLDKALDETIALDDGELTLPSLPDSLFRALDSLENSNRKQSKGKTVKLSREFKEFARECYRFHFLYENYFDNLEYYLSDDDGKTINLYCLDPGNFLAASIEGLAGSVFFSATMSPVEYFEESLLGSKGFKTLMLPSPFPKENFCLMIDPISTRYRDRDFTMHKIANHLKAYVESKIGNYFIYFPSYEYMRKMEPFLNISDADIHMQKKDMDDLDKQEFLLNFKPNPDKTAVGLVVIGGAFSEGIDLQDDRLIGVAVVGIGLPKVCKEREILKQYFDEKNGQGFLFSYLNPGINKVMQAVGRLIRSEYDVGSALLIDDRYSQSVYRKMFEGTWDHYEIVLNENDIAETLESFFNKKG